MASKNVRVSKTNSVVSKVSKANNRGPRVERSVKKVAMDSPTNITGDIIGSPASNSRGTSSASIADLPDNMKPKYDYVDDGVIDVGDLNGKIPKTRVVGKGDTSTLGREFNPDMFNPSKFIDRITKFYSRHSETLKKRLNGKGKSALPAFIKECYVDHFSSPQVAVGVERLSKIMKDFTEMDGKIEDSLLIENIFDDLGYSLQDVLSGNHETAPTKKEPAPRETPKMEQTEIDYSKEMLEKGPIPKKFWVIKEQISTTIIPIEELDEGVKIEHTNKSKGQNNPGAIHLLGVSEFESCKKFNCHKFSLVSMANALERSGQPTHPSHNTLFKTCCATFNKEGCPQGSEYDEVEQLIYNTAIETHNDPRIAHAQILAYRFKKNAKK